MRGKQDSPCLWSYHFVSHHQYNCQVANQVSPNHVVRVEHSVTNMAPFMPFRWSYDNAINGTNGFVEWTFLDPRDEVKMPYKAKHEERTKKNTKIGRVLQKPIAPEEPMPKHRCIRWLSEEPTPWLWCKTERLQLLWVTGLTDALCIGLTDGPWSRCSCVRKPTATSVAVSVQKNRCPCTGSSDAHAEKLLTATNG